MSFINNAAKKNNEPSGLNCSTRSQLMSACPNCDRNVDVNGSMGLGEGRCEPGDTRARVA